MVRMAKQAAPIERLTKFADHIREHDVEAERYGFQVQEASEFFKLYPKRKSPVKNQPDGVGFFRNERKEIFVLYKPRLHRVRRPTEVLNKMGQGWRQFKFTRKELGDKDFEMFYKYSQGLIPGRAEAQTFSSLLLVYYRHLNGKGEYEASESESEEGIIPHHHHHNLNGPHHQVVPSSYYSPSASSCSAASPVSSPASSIGHSPSPSSSSFSPSLSPVPMAAFAPPQFRSFQQHQQHQLFHQHQHQHQQLYLSPFTLPPYTPSRSSPIASVTAPATTVAPSSMDMMNMMNMSNTYRHQQHHQHHQQQHLSIPEISITGPVEEEENYGMIMTTRTTTSTTNHHSNHSFQGFSNQQMNQEQQQQQQQQHEEPTSSSSSSGYQALDTSFEPTTGSFGSHEFIEFDFEDDFNGSGVRIEEIEDYSHISFV